MEKLTLMQVFEYPDETLFECSLGVQVKTVGKKTSVKMHLSF